MQKHKNLSFFKTLILNRQIPVIHIKPVVLSSAKKSNPPKRRIALWYPVGWSVSLHGLVIVFLNELFKHKAAHEGLLTVVYLFLYPPRVLDLFLYGKICYS